MKPTTTLAAFSIVLVSAFGVGAAIGSNVEPIATETNNEPHTDTTQTVQIENYTVTFNDTLEPHIEPEPTITVERNGEKRTGRIIFDTPTDNTNKHS